MSTAMTMGCSGAARMSAKPGTTRTRASGPAGVTKATIQPSRQPSTPASHRVVIASPDSTNFKEVALTGAKRKEQVGPGFLLRFNAGYRLPIVMLLRSGLFTENESSEAADARPIRYTHFKAQDFRFASIRAARRCPMMPRSGLFTKNESSERANARSIRYARVKWACGNVCRCGAKRSWGPARGRPQMTALTASRRRVGRRRVRRCHRAPAPCGRRTAGTGSRSRRRRRGCDRSRNTCCRSRPS
jgi:hypothetical protein